VGARPQIIKAAALSRAIKNHYSEKIHEVIVHTGQHYDENMSQVFFDELGIPSPDINLSVGSGSHGRQTATMIEGIEQVILDEKPNAIVVYGDTNSTLAAGVAASKIHVPVVHIEAGLRSYNKKMPEEINRIMCDHVSSLLFSPTKTGVENLLKEGFIQEADGNYSMDNPGVFHCGDVMYDNSIHFSEISAQESTVLANNKLNEGEYILSTIHRNDNTDTPERITGIFEALQAISKENNVEIVLPLHPRTSKILTQNLPSELYQTIQSNPNIKLIPPVSFLDMIALEKNAKLVITDSGGVQKEAFFFNKACIILRPETEWVELVSCGSAKIVGWSRDKIIEAYNRYSDDSNLQFPPVFGNGKAAEFICDMMLKHLS
jgi:UDP-GlcNAc3NAcA epimerase